VEQARALLRGGNPTLARKSARPPLPLQSIRARRAVGFQKRLRMPRNRGDYLHRTVAASTISGAAAEVEQAAAMTELAALHRIIFVKVAAAFDKAPTSSDTAGAILHGREDRQSGLHRSRSRWHARDSALPWTSNRSEERQL